MELLIVLGGLILLNAVFAMSEIAVVSSRKARLQRMVDEGRKGAEAALQLHDAPSTFLSTIQVGITSVGILAGAIGENALAAPIADWLSQFALIAPYARGLALALVVVVITYVSVVVGELVPKRLGLLRPEVIAVFVARPMNWLARLARPLVWLLSASSDVILRVLRINRSDEPPVTDEEIEVLMEQGAEAGVFHASEQEIVANVLRLDEQRVPAIMTPRKDIDYVDLEHAPDEQARKIADTPHHRIVVCRGGLDNVVGVLSVSDLLKPALEHRPLAIERAMRQPLYVPDTVSTTQLIEHFRKARQDFALIVDEYGELQGLVTLHDVLISIVGELPEEGAHHEPDAVRRDDGSWLFDGGIGIERFRDLLEIDELQAEEEGDFHTLAGFVLHHLGHIPKVGEHFEAAGLRFEIVDMDRNRVDRVLVSRLPTPLED